MAKSKDDITYGTAQAKLSEDETLRVRYKHGTPLEGGKIADSDPIHLFSSAHRIEQTQNKIADSEPVQLFSTAPPPNNDPNNPSSSPSDTNSDHGLSVAPRQ